MEDTKVIYHIDDEETPYLLVSADSSTKSDGHSTGGDPHTTTNQHGQIKGSTSACKPAESGPNKTTQDLPSEQEHAVGTTGHNLEECETCAESDSVYSGDRVPPLRNFYAYKHGSRLARLSHRIQAYETSSSMMSSDLESTSFFDSEDESSRFSTATGTTMSSVKYGRNRKHRKRRGVVPIPRISEDASSFSSMTDSTMSLNVIVVTLNMNKVNFLGISIVGQSNKAGDGGIYVGSIMRGGAVAQDGRIEPGDMILEVNRISFEDMSNDEAVRVLREEVQKPGPITLVVAKCWDPSPKDYFTVPRQEPIQPIDPRAWVLHTNAMTGAVVPGGIFNSPNNPSGAMGGLMSGAFLGMGPNVGMPLGSVAPCMPQLLPPSLAAHSGGRPTTVSNVTSKSLPEVNDPNDLSDPRSRYRGPGSSGNGGAGTASTKTAGSRSAGGGDMDPIHGASWLTLAKSAGSLTVTTDMASVVHSMLMPDSGLEIHDRTWLKITIPNAFIGSDLVDWLYAHVDGFTDRKDSRRYATDLLKYGYIRHTVNKNTFSEQCYYVFGDIASALAHLTFEELDSVSEVGVPPHLNLLPSHGFAPMHPISDNVSSGLTSVLPNPIASSANNSMFGLMPVTSQDCTGQMAQTMPSFPSYGPPVLYTGHTSNGPRLLDIQSPPQISLDTNGIMNPSSAMQGPMRLNSHVSTTNPMENTTTIPGSQPMLHAPGNGVDSVPNSYPITTRPHMAAGHQHLVGHSSSSSSSSASNSSAASSGSGSSTGSSSTASPSGTRRRRHHHLHSTNKTAVIQLTTNGPDPTTNAPSGFVRNAPPSVQSASGASSASSTSRQNGTGASAAGSGNGSTGNNNTNNNHTNRPVDSTAYCVDLSSGGGRFCANPSTRPSLTSDRMGSLSELTGMKTGHLGGNVNASVPTRLQR